MKNSRPYYIIVFGLFLGICAPSLWSDGMFMDGLYYAAISRNLADGLGSFWYLHFTDFSYPIFHEHPPLAMGLQSILFYFFGDSIYIERLYSFFTFIFTGAIIHLIWGEINRKELKYMHAQMQVIPFYEKIGFKKIGDSFEEAGIMHYKMILK